jgi:hypothetical protein
MATNPLKQAIKSGVAANDYLNVLFARIGNNEHTNGVVMVAYENARRALTTALTESDPLRAARDVMNGLRTTVRADVRLVLWLAQKTGAEEAARQLGYYGVDYAGSVMGLSEQLGRAMDAIIAGIDQQAKTVEVLLLTGSEEMILGGDASLGIVRPSYISRLAAFFTAKLMWDAFSESISGYEMQTGERKFKKQAVAAIDQRTTDCCLRVHGQIQPLNKPFELTGVPRYADELDWSPFHDWCRTSIVLYQGSYDMGLTSQMREAADTVLQERGSGINRRRHPADAYG